MANPIKTLQKNYEAARKAFLKDPTPENHIARTEAEQTLAEAVRASRLGRPSGIIAEEN